MAGEQIGRSREMDCIGRHERALGLEGEIADIESTNDEILQMLRELAPADYVEALVSGSSVLPPLGPDTQLSTMTRIRQLTERYTGNKTIAAEYAQERQTVLADSATGATCRVDISPDDHESDLRMGALVEAKFRRLAADLAARPTLENEPYLYRHEGEGSYGLFPRRPGAEGQNDPLDPMKDDYDGLFFPADPQDPEGGIYNVWGNVNGYFFGTSGLMKENGDYDAAAVARFMAMTPDDVLREAAAALPLLREAAKRNAENLAAAESLAKEIQGDESLDYFITVYWNTVQFHSREKDPQGIF